MRPNQTLTTLVLHIHVKHRHDVDSRYGLKVRTKRRAAERPVRSLTLDREVDYELKKLHVCDLKPARLECANTALSV